MYKLTQNPTQSVFSIFKTNYRDAITYSHIFKMSLYSPTTMRNESWEEYFYESPYLYNQKRETIPHQNYPVQLLSRLHV